MNDPQIGEVGAAYRGVRERITALVEGAPSVDEVVPDCPEWRIHDLVAHAAGVIDDVLGGRLDGAGSDPWTAAQVEARRNRPTSEVLSEWAEQSVQVEGIVDSFGPPGRQLVMDVVSHEHDLRAAMGAAGEATDTDAVSIGTGWLLDAMSMAAPVAVRIRLTDGREWTTGASDAGGGTPVATVTGSAFDLLRSASGRRSGSEIRSLDWEGDVDAALPAFTFGPFRPRP